MSKEKKIEMQIECPDCDGTGLYCGMGEGNGAAVVCRTCKGKGEKAFQYLYNEFTGRKSRTDVQRVYLSGMGYKIGTGKINFKNGIGEIDMDKEGVSYAEFLAGKMPTHIKKLGCPMSVDQGACHGIKGFVDKCEELNGGWIGLITDCKHQPNKMECWKRFEANSK